MPSTAVLRAERRGTGSVRDGVSMCAACSDEDLEAERVRSQIREQKRNKQWAHSETRSGNLSNYLLREPDEVKNPQDEYLAMWYGAKEIRERHGIDPEEQWRQRKQGRYACYETGDFYSSKHLELFKIRERAAVNWSQWRRVSPGVVGWLEDYKKWVKEEERSPLARNNHDLKTIRNVLGNMEENRPGDRQSESTRVEYRDE
ncbi:hypothetical protein [Halococcus thailandensis]|uniref:hypothetical protein n=1 Tax=Halococcus thailandensis TaxID=335952 RepID=UPI001268D741|nr:hypothetical protein [Halococcus thailandensis]